MAHDCLANFLEMLAARGQLTRIAAEVDPDLELAEITRRVAQAGGAALLFDRVLGGSMGVVSNLLGTNERLCLALDLESVEGLPGRIDELVRQHTPQNWYDRLKLAGGRAGIDKFDPRVVKTGPCQQVVRLGRDVDLRALPLVRQWPQEELASLGSASVIVRATSDGPRRASIARLFALDATRLAMLTGGERPMADSAAGSEKVPLALVVGGDPALAALAQLETPEEIDFYHLAGMARGKAIDLVPCRTNPVEVPAETDLVIEGFLDPAVERETITVASAGTGYYVSRLATVIHVTAITHRSHPLIPLSIDCAACGETAIVASAHDRWLLENVRAVAPEVTDVALPVDGGAGVFAFVAIRKTEPFQARRVASALWGTRVLSTTRFLILVDEGVNVREPRCILSELGANVRIDADLFFHESGRAADELGSAVLERCMGIDATRKLASERASAVGSPLEGDAKIAELVSARWAEYKLPTSAPPSA